MPSVSLPGDLRAVNLVIGIVEQDLESLIASGNLLLLSFQLPAIQISKYKNESLLLYLQKIWSRELDKKAPKGC